jgi:23S rRNA (uracil1939-C5)-methyltransferase
VKELVELDVTALAAGGHGVARDAAGRVTFVPRTAPGDRVRAALVRATKTFARAELVEVIAPSPDRVAPPCRHFEEGCGGCTWQHVARPVQLAAKQAIVEHALRSIASSAGGAGGARVHPIIAAAPPYGWRRRARFHVRAGAIGLYAEASHRLVAIASCPQLEPALDRALAAVRNASPPDGELALVAGHRGDVVVGVERVWPAGAKLVGRAGITGVIAGDTTYGAREVELDAGLEDDPRYPRAEPVTGALVVGPWQFAQPSRAGNDALVRTAAAALGIPDPPSASSLLELYAGNGNLTRGYVAAGWRVTTTDAAFGSAITGDASGVIAKLTGTFDAVALDPPRTGAPREVIDGIARLQPRAIVYVSCDPATLARDLARLADLGYRATDAWPLDPMPQTAHVEVVVSLTAREASD